MTIKLSLSSLKPAIPATDSPGDVPADKARDLLIVQGRANEATQTLVDSAVEQQAVGPEYFPPAAPAPEPDGDLGLTSEDVVVKAVDKLDRLVADDFPFDDSQWSAIYGVVQQQFACLIGAAGTGKTTCTKKVVDLIKRDVGEVDMSDYWKRSKDEDEAETDSFGDDADDYVKPRGRIPSIVLCGFTGRSTQMVKKNFPESWHGNIMTIHRLLAYMPEYYDDFDDNGKLVKKMRFVPTYDENRLLPWDVIVIDEAGMVSLELWHNLWRACKPGTRIIMIGDINQLPPPYGQSVFGFAMTQWPTYELTHIHRQVGANNSIVDAAHAILKGIRPKSDGAPDFTLDGKDSAEVKQNTLKVLQHVLGNPDWKFTMVALPENTQTAASRVRQVVKFLADRKFYDSELDTIITAINGYEPSANGYILGQAPLNRELALMLNPDSPRYIIDAGRTHQFFAVGDKVMATKNDYEAGITNGMTGIITEIVRNPDYGGNPHKFGLLEDVQAWQESQLEEEHEIDVAELMEAAAKELDKKEKESKDRGPASHSIIVRFGQGNHAIERTFTSLAEVDSLVTAYAVTCHKMQGGESPLIMGIIHTTHRRMMTREWAYTMVTRASGRCIMFYTESGLRAALVKQAIKGQSLGEKVQSFLTESGGIPDSITLPPAKGFKTSLVIPDHVRITSGNIMDAVHRQNQVKSGLDVKAMLLGNLKVERVIERVTIIERKTVEVVEVTPMVDGGELKRKEKPAPVNPNPTPTLFQRMMLNDQSLPWAKQQMLLEDKRSIDYTEPFFDATPVVLPEPPKPVNKVAALLQLKLK